MSEDPVMTRPNQPVFRVQDADIGRIVPILPETAGCGRMPLSTATGRRRRSDPGRELREAR